MSDNQFAMISDWMANGNINDFVKAHPEAKRLELVGFSLSASVPFIDGRMIHLAGGCRYGIDLHPQPGNDSRGYQRGALLMARGALLSY